MVTALAPHGALDLADTRAPQFRDADRLSNREIGEAVGMLMLPQQHLRTNRNKLTLASGDQLPPET
ncbi:hypothetical protein DIJ64_08830 [Mycobacterium leprae]|uniref:Uncharacterized protein n=1 Tax=Mycobacterium leprae TaxID=1769 RepID=A0AAD0P727_MYCLR|nr:hypothetical protein [Mycobacterium leprae]AWV48127.1 hypothetical protein DIJ64_08830 [Mycobacterium leprae]OAR21631.1 hypothetical protein A8144_05095 [Mycobacterium leprae 3125609]OAX71785.1 hypothetical protein A3216_03810 [Mycobacterium leprae 7935681]